MRVLVLLGKFFGVFAILAGLIFFVGREILLFSSYTMLQREVERLRTALRSSKEYAITCRDAFASSQELYALAGVQLRFTNDRDYRVELVCTQRENDPILLRSGSLMMFVRKLGGSSGLYLGVGMPVNTALDLELWGRTYEVTVRDPGAAGQKIIYPTASCTGWGYQCCDPITQVPNGIPASGGVNDCRLSCYSACKNRPVVLSFRSDPQASIDTKTVVLKGAETDVAFTAIINNPDSMLEEVVLDFGDGERETFTTTQVATTHTYRCTQPSCTYAAKIMASDAEGLSSPDLQTSMITIIVQP